MSKPAPVGLGTERDAPPYFAGRHDELAALNKRLDHLCRTGDPRGGIALVVGVPGAGKTQLGRKFSQDAMQRSGNLDVRCMETDIDMLESDIGLFRQIAKALGCEQLGREVAEMDTRVAAAGAGIATAKGQVTRDFVRHTGRLFELLIGAKDAGGWLGKALVLVIDELQAVRPAGIRTLRMLHQGSHGCPILLLGIGLQHTLQVLGNPADGSAGISRAAKPIRLHCMADSQAREAIDGNMRALGHSVGARCAAALAKASYGFPQHVHGYLEGALEAIDRHGALEVGTPLDEALAAGNQARVDYYNARLGMLADRDVVLPVVRAMTQSKRRSLPRAETVLAVDQARYDGEGTVDQAVRHGVLTADDEGRLSFGIPSFPHPHDTTACGRALEGARRALKGRVRALRNSASRGA